jgi:hypothetical protein
MSELLKPERFLDELNVINQSYCKGIPQEKIFSSGSKEHILCVLLLSGLIFSHKSITPKDCIAFISLKDL